MTNPTTTLCFLILYKLIFLLFNFLFLVAVKYAMLFSQVCSLVHRMDKGGYVALSVV